MFVNVFVFMSVNGCGVDGVNCSSDWLLFGFGCRNCGTHLIQFNSVFISLFLFHFVDVVCHGYVRFGYFVWRKIEKACLLLTRTTKLFSFHSTFNSLDVLMPFAWRLLFSYSPFAVFVFVRENNVQHYWAQIWIKKGEKWEIII